MSRSVLACQLLNRHGLFVDTWTGLPDHAASTAVFFLTHFHADHMQGLNANFRFSKIYCTHETCCLLLTRFPGLKDVVTGCNYCETMVHRGSSFDVCFTMFDAGHCSGSAMILFESTKIGRILSTGDFRFDNQIMLDAMLPFVSTSRLDYLVLDATFCTEICPEFPSKNDASKVIIDLIKIAPSHIKVMVNLQPLGAEVLIQAICITFNCKVHLDFPVADIQVLIALPFFQKYCTCDESLRFSICCPQRFKEEIGRTRNRACDVGPLLIKASSMWFAQERLCHRSMIESEPGVYRVLYSMHSSLNEIREFVRQVMPNQIAFSALPFDFNPESLPNEHQEKLERIIGGRYRKCAGGQNEFFKKFKISAKQAMLSAQKRQFPAIVPAKLVSETKSLSSLDSFKERSVLLHSQLDLSTRHQAVALVTKLGAKRTRNLVDADIVIIDSSKRDAWRALRRIVNSASKLTKIIQVFDAAVLHHIQPERSFSDIEQQFSLWNSSQLTPERIAELAAIRCKALEPRAYLSPISCRSGYF